MLLRHTVFLLFLTLVAFACTNPKLTIDDLVEKGELLDATTRQLNGKWRGVYQALDPSFDTIFYQRYEDKLEYLLSGTITDSSLVKQIILRDTFEIKPVRFEFIPDDSVAWSGLARITFAGDSTVALPARLNLPINLSDGPVRVGFGTAGSDSLTYEAWYQYELTSIVSFDDAFSTGVFVLAIQQLTDDSLRFSLPGGYGKMVLGKNMISR